MIQGYDSKPTVESLEAMRCQLPLDRHICAFGSQHEPREDLIVFTVKVRLDELVAILFEIRKALDERLAPRLDTSFHGAILYIRTVQDWRVLCDVELGPVNLSRDTDVVLLNVGLLPELANEICARTGMCTLSQ